jgi:hypothetical protein
LSAQASKHRKEDRQPIRPELADVLRTWLAARPAGGPAFDVPERRLRP